MVLLRSLAAQEIAILFIQVALLVVLDVLAILEFLCKNAPILWEILCGKPYCLSHGRAGLRSASFFAFRIVNALLRVAKKRHMQIKDDSFRLMPCRKLGGTEPQIFHTTNRCVIYANRLTSGKIFSLTHGNTPLEHATGHANASRQTGDDCAKKYQKAPKQFSSN